MASTGMQVIAHAEADVPQLPHCTHLLATRTRLLCVRRTREAQGSLRLGATHCMHAPYVPLTWHHR